MSDRTVPMFCTKCGSALVTVEIPIDWRANYGPSAGVRIDHQQRCPRCYVPERCESCALEPTWPACQPAGETTRECRSFVEAKP